MRYLRWSCEIQQILEAMDFSVYTDDTKHIIIDNLQFMMPRMNFLSAKSAFGKFEFMDSIIDKFRRFATEKNVNIILVVHPRKEEESSDLTISSVFGSAKATQEADLVLILQKQDDVLRLDIKKNRYDGVLGKLQLGFNRGNNCFYEMSPNQEAAAEKPKRQMKKPVKGNEED